MVGPVPSLGVAGAVDLGGQGGQPTVDAQLLGAPCELVGVVQRAELAADQVLTVDAQQPLRSEVGEADHALAVGGHDRGPGGRLEQGRGELLLPPQLLLRPAVDLPPGDGLPQRRLPLGRHQRQRQGGQGDDDEVDLDQRGDRVVGEHRDVGEGPASPSGQHGREGTDGQRLGRDRAQGEDQRAPDEERDGQEGDRQALADPVDQHGRHHRGHDLHDRDHARPGPAAHGGTGIGQRAGPAAPRAAATRRATT